MGTAEKGVCTVEDWGKCTQESLSDYMKEKLHQRRGTEQSCGA